jgi:hypothetical protein
VTGQHDRDELGGLLSRYADVSDTRNWDELPRTVTCDEIVCDCSALGAPADVRRLDSDAPCDTNHRIAIDGDRATVRAHVRAEHWARPEVAAGGRIAGWSSAFTTMSRCGPPMAGG